MSDTNSDVVKNFLSAEFLTSGDGAYVVENDHYIVVGADGIKMQLPTKECNLNAEELHLLFGETLYVVKVGGGTGTGSPILDESTTQSSSADDFSFDSSLVENSGSASDNQPAIHKSNSNVVETKHYWSDSETKLLLAEYQKHIVLVSSRKIRSQKRMWELIAEVFKTYDYQIDSSQIENRFKTLKRDYLKVKTWNTKTGRSTRECAFEKELDDLFGHKDTVEPAAMVQSNKLTTKRKASGCTSTAPAPAAFVEVQEGLDDDYDDENKVDDVQPINSNEDIEIRENSVSPSLVPKESSPVSSELTSTTSSCSTPNPKKSNHGATAKKLQRLTDTLQSVENRMEEKKKSTQEFQKQVLALYEQEKDSSAEFRARLLEQRDEKLSLLKLLVKNTTMK